MTKDEAQRHTLQNIIEDIDTKIRHAGINKQFKVSVSIPEFALKHINEHLGQLNFSYSTEPEDWRVPEHGKWYQINIRWDF